MLQPRHAVLLAALLAFGLCAMPRSLWAGEPAVADFKGRMAEAEAHLAAGCWATADQLADDLIEDLIQRLPATAEERNFLALPVTYKAIAAAAEERRDDALWWWATAQNLAPEFRRLPLPDYGPPSALLAGERLREAGVVPDGVFALPAEPLAEGITYPAPLVVPVARPSADLARSPAFAAYLWRSDEIDIEAVIDVEGRVKAPVLMRGELPGKIYLAFQALRGWRFAPVRAADGRPIAGLVVLSDIDSSAGFTFAVARSEVLEPIHEQLVAGRWGDALAAASARLDTIADAPDIGVGLKSDLLILRALAEAGGGRNEDAIWHWHLAYSYRTELASLAAVEARERPRWGVSAADLAAYGDAGRLLLRHPMLCSGDGANRCDAIRLEGPGSAPEVRPPRLIFGPPVPLPTRFREQGPERLIVRAVVGTDGRIRELRVLAGRSPVVVYLALESLRDWRFEPAVQRGRPVESVVNWSVPFAPDAAPETVAGWRRRADELDAALRSSSVMTATLAAAAVLSEEIAAGATFGGSDLLARAVALKALAEAGLGRVEEAAWHWQEAQNLAVELRYLDLTPYGAAGELLAGHPLRWPPGEVEQATAGTSPTGTGEQVAPKAVANPAPRFPPTRAGRPEVATVELVVGADGWPRDPLVLHGQGAAVHTALEALREWRFEPARRDGKPVAARYRVDLPLAAGCRSKDLLCDVSDPDAMRLAKLALASARNGKTRLAACLWAGAQDLASALGGREFAADVVNPVRYSHPEERWPLRRDPISQMTRTIWPPEGHDLQPPVRVFAPNPQYTDQARRARITGSLVVLLTIDERGDVVAPRILRGLPLDPKAIETALWRHRLRQDRGLPLGLNAQVIETVCTWKFEPATLNGIPVPVYYHSTITFSFFK